MRSVLGPGIGFGPVEFVDAFVLAEIRPVVQLLQQHEPGAGRRGLAQPRLDRIEIGIATAAVGFLQQRDLERGSGHGIMKGMASRPC